IADMLNKEGGFTLLAPTDDAFRAMPAAELAQLTDPANKERLAKLLKLHLASTIADSSSLKRRSVLQTAAGQSVGVTVAGDSILIDRSRVTKADIRCSNGVVHVLDAVL